MAKIDAERLAKLEDAEYKLQCLEAGGVDNWNFYGEALTPYFEMKEEEEKVDDFVVELCEIFCENAEEPAGRGCGYGVTEDGQADIKSAMYRFIKDVKEVK